MHVHIYWFGRGEVHFLMLRVIAGLFAGPEGPMVHIGAIVGASVSRFYTDVVLSGARDWTTFNTLKNVRISTCLGGCVCAEIDNVLT